MEIHEPRNLPLGTRVLVTETAGSASRVGVVVSHGEDLRVTVRFPDGGTREFPRADVRVHRYDQEEIIPPTEGSDRHALRAHVIYRCVVGSRAFGLATEDSDTDRRGIYLAPLELGWSLAGCPEQIEFPESEEAYWELRKFLILALRANPNILECLYTPMVEHATPLAEELLRKRDIFLSKQIYRTYNAYVLSQFKKMTKDLENHGGVRVKHAMHLIRLLISGIGILRSGFLRLEVAPECRERLLAIRRGEVPWGEVERWRLELHREFDRAHEASGLPDRPDSAAVNAFLIHARRSMTG